MQLTGAGRRGSKASGSVADAAVHLVAAGWLLQELGMQPYVLLWLRYTAFIVLYPLGVSSELAEVALAMPAIRATRPLSIQASGRCAAAALRHSSVLLCQLCVSWLRRLQMPNKFNFAFDYYWACWLVVLLYLPGAGQQLWPGLLFVHLLVWAALMLLPCRLGGRHLRCLQASRSSTSTCWRSGARSCASAASAAQPS